TIAYFGRLPHYSSLFARDGFPRETERLKDAWTQNDEARAMRAVTDEMVLALSATGTPDDIALRLDALLQAGLKQAVLFPLSTDGDAKSAILRTIEFWVLAPFNPYWSLLISAATLLVPAKGGR